MAYKIKPKSSSKMDKKYLLKLKRRFSNLENIPYSELSMTDLEEMKEIREELIKLGKGEWHR